jgi:amyloid beta precursor protein binding protein 1
VAYRIWGEQGQGALEQANICVLNVGPTGSEVLKNLVLGGIGSFTIVDGSIVEEADLGNNFLGWLFTLTKRALE